MSPPRLPIELARIIGQPMHGVARVVLEHQRRQQFRPVVFLELSLGLVCFACLVPLMLLAGDIDLELWRGFGRFHQYWHELRITLLGPQQQVLHVVSHRASGGAEGDAIVGALLAAVHEQGIVAVEAISSGGGAAETTEVWYGGRPLLAHPHDVSESEATAVLRQAGLEIETQGDQVVIRQPDRVDHPLLLGAAMLVALPFVPLLLLFAEGRRSLRFAWLGLRGVEGCRQVVVRAECLKTQRARGSMVWREALIQGKELLGVTFSPALRYDTNVSRTEATLRLVGRWETHSLDLERARGAERALRDLIVAATIRLRQAQPELGLLGKGPHPTRCPYCATSFVMEPGSECPTCGAPAGKV